MNLIKTLWQECGENPKTKFRFADWGHSTKYFQIAKTSSCGQFFEGLLDTGEELLIPTNSDFWFEYFPGDEENARAV